MARNWTFEASRGRVHAEEEAAEPEERENGEVRSGRRRALGLPDFERWGEIERIPFRGVPPTAGGRTEVAWNRVPHLTHLDVADVTALEEFRRARASRVTGDGGDLSPTVLVMKAVVAALAEYPRFNASLDDAALEIILKRHYHVGVMVDTDRGLVVPVVRDVDEKSLVEVAVETSRLVERALAGEIDPEETRGGTFTITDLGPFGGTALTPIVRWPEVAILGIGKTRLGPLMEGPDGARVAPPRQLPLCLAFDRRVNDGADAARFVGRIVEILENPDSFAL